MKIVVPKTVKCDQCGRLSPVISWIPIYEDLSPVESVSTPPRTKGFTCKLDCSSCGIRIQIMPASK